MHHLLARSWLCVLLALVGCSAEAAPAPSSPGEIEPPAGEVLREWDARRAAAYAAGSVGELRSLYVVPSPAGRADVHLLRTYLVRGLVVEGMTMQVLALEELRRTDRVLEVRVTDRLVGATVRGPTGVYRLPHDAPTTRVVKLRRTQGEWRVASVLAQGRGQA